MPSGKQNGMYGRVGVLSPRWRGGTTPLRQKLYARGIWKKKIQEVLEFITPKISAQVKINN